MPDSDAQPAAAESTASAPEPMTRNPWAWIPSLYIAEGLPYAVVMSVSVIMYKGLGVSNTDIALYTSSLYWPWVIKPLWSPVVDLLKTRRIWIWVMQLVVGAAFAGVALSLQGSDLFRYSLAFLWLLAFSSATHDIAADGFYMLALNEKEQAFFVGIRSTFYRVAMIAGQGLLVILAGFIQSQSGLPRVDLPVFAEPGVPLMQAVGQDWRVSASPAQQNLFVVVESERLAISPEPRSRSDVDALILAARDRNAANGFYQVESKPAEAAGPISRFFGRIGKFLSAPFRWIASVLEPWLRDRFGEVRRSSDAAGNVGIVQLQLSRPPGSEIVVTLRMRSGDKSISVVEGTRLRFDDGNWNRPAVVVFQLDPKLGRASSAVCEIRSGNIRFSWLVVFVLLAVVFGAFGLYHRIVLPRPSADTAGAVRTVSHFFKEFWGTLGSYFCKSRIGVLLLFLLLYRFAEAQLVKMAAPFLLDGREIGGLALTTGQVGFVYGTVGIAALTCGGVLGGFLASRQGLRFWLWPMVLAIHLPDAVYVYLAYAQPENLWIISSCVAVEQFGYGFGFTGYMLYMIYIARGRHQTAHYALCTGFMALGMMLPGMWSGWLEEIIGYRHFFVWVMLATIPAFVITALIPLDREFGRKAEG